MAPVARGHHVNRAGDVDASGAGLAVSGSRRDLRRGLTVVGSRGAEYAEPHSLRVHRGFDCIPAILQLARGDEHDATADVAVARIGKPQLSLYFLALGIGDDAQAVSLRRSVPIVSGVGQGTSPRPLDPNQRNPP